MKNTIQQDFNERFKIGQWFSLWNLNHFIERNGLDTSYEKGPDGKMHTITVTLNGEFLREFTTGKMEVKNAL